ncbi:MAG: hypothetical protein HRT68_15250 [Flavobacteriaceae bacterium]|nr:hypothetical protein [Flavobacteriaceae bacterium]
MSLTTLKKTVKDALDDLATLEVATFTGKEIDLSQSTDTTKVFETIQATLTTSTLVGYSRFEVEGDSMNYTNSDLGPDKQYLLDAHSSLVEGAQKSRKDFFDFVLKVMRS